MKILRLLNRKYLSILFFTFLLIFYAKAEDKPIDIWNIDKNENNQTELNNTQNVKESVGESLTESSIYKMQSQKKIDTVEVDSSLDSQEIKIIGLYDPEDYDLKIDMWSNSNGDQLKYLFANLTKFDLSNDASNLMNIAMLTNSYYPEINITENEFLKIKSDWLIKNKDRDLIEKYLIKNKILNQNPDLSRYLIDQYLSESNIEKACELFSKIQK